MPKPAVADHLGIKLAEAIAEKGVQQKDVAIAFGVKAPTVSSDWIKHGRIHKKHIPKLVRYFERPYEWWFEDWAAMSGEEVRRTFAVGLSARLHQAMQRSGYMKADSSPNVDALAKNAGCPPSVIMKCLDADEPPAYIDALVALRLCDELSVTPYWLLLNEGSLNDDVPVGEKPMQDIRHRKPPPRRTTKEAA